MKDYTFKSIAEQAKAIKENQLSPVTLVENYIHNINKNNSSDKIFSEIFYVTAIEEARQSENRQKKALEKVS